MQVVLKVWSSSPDYSAGCDYGALEISDELAKLMLRRINILGEQKATDASAYETYYWDFSPEVLQSLVESNRSAGQGSGINCRVGGDAGEDRS